MAEKRQKAVTSPYHCIVVSGLKMTTDEQLCFINHNYNYQEGSFYG